jgi:probable F420-dependent oxidoreductase
MPVEFGLLLLGKELQELRELAQAAEQLGYASLFLPDHIVYPVGGSYDPHTPSWDQMVALAVVFEATRKIRAGHLLLCNLFRHPVMTAQSLVTLDHLSSGRLVAGLGAGWSEVEFRMSGIPFPSMAPRLRMLDEALSCIRSLWTREQTTFEGEFYKLKDAILWPKPVQHPHPPILLGGRGRGLLRVAGKHAAVVDVKPDRIAAASTKESSESAFKAKIQFVREEASKNRRTPDSIQIGNTVLMVKLADSAKEAASLASSMAQSMGVGLQQLLASPMALVGTPEGCGVELNRRAKEWGVSRFVFGGDIDLNTIERLASEVIPRVTQ